MGRESHCTPEERRIAIRLRNNSKSLAEIAATLARSRNLVVIALKLHTSEENRGSARKTSTRDDNRMERMAKADPFKSSWRIAAELNDIVSARRLVDAGLPGHMARKVPFLSSRNLRMRNEFASTHSNSYAADPSKQWRNVLWSDETKIHLFSNDCARFVRRPKGKEFGPWYTKKAVINGGGNIMVWECFSHYGVGPIIQIDRIMTRFEYVESFRTYTRFGHHVQHDAPICRR